MLIGYMRISTSDQETSLQEDALKKAGCQKIFKDVASGSIDARPGLKEAISFARSSDTLVVWRLDRLGRSLRHLIDTVRTLEDRKINFISLTESLDTSSPADRLVFHIFGALAEFERELIRGRTRAGLEAARSRGRIGGRPALMDDKRSAIAKTLMSKGDSSPREVAETLGISRATLYRALQ